MSDKLKAARERALEIMRSAEAGRIAAAEEEAKRDACQDCATLTAEVERLKGEAEEARANLLLQTICRLPSVLTTDDWQAYLDEHREEWLSDDRAFGGWVSQRLSVALATARADVLQEVRAVIGGCGDNSCLFVRPKGMATNGGCRCLRQPGIGQKLAALLGGAA